MAHGSTLSYARGQLRARPSWHAALRRGAILGSVTALHLLTMALVLRPMPPYRWARTAIHDDDQALHLSFVAQSDKPRSASPPSRLRRPRATRPPTRVAALPPPSAATPSHAVAVTPPASMSDGSGDYRPATLDAGLRGMQQTSRVRLPGSDTPLRPGLQLRTAPSLQEVVRMMTTANRCKYERMKMESSANQFVTRQLVERALGADGCGPQTEHAAVDATIDAISRRALLDD